MTSEERSDPGAEAVGAGTLVLVVGASGVGKDTLIDAARRTFKGDSRLAFPERVITRQDQSGEAHVAVDNRDFEQLREAGSLFLAWEAHGHKYGIPVAIAEMLEAGRSVVVNVSRQVIAEARAAWPKVSVVHVTVRSEVLRDRLSARGRENPESIEQRLARAEAVSVPTDAGVVEIDNSGAPDEAAACFTALLEQVCDGR